MKSDTKIGSVSTTGRPSHTGHITAEKKSMPLMIIEASPDTDSVAQACATESVSGDASMIIKGIDFFSAVMWPVWEGLPVVDTLPIFVSDFTAPNSLSHCVYSIIIHCAEQSQISPKTQMLLAFNF